jgi:hypothetical protein
MKKIITLIIALLLSVSYAADNAPLGLVWGQKILSSQCLSKSEKIDDKTGLVLCVLKDVPNPIPDLDGVTVVLSPERNLLKVRVFFKDISEDPYGSKGIKEFTKYTNILTKKYKEPGLHKTITGVTLYENSDEFYQCLRYAGCGMYLAIWDLPDGGAISLELKGIARGKGFIVISYETPAFSAELRKSEERNRKKAESSL